MKYKKEIINRIQEVHSFFSTELLKYTFLEPVIEDSIDEILVRSLVTYSPIFLPVYEKYGDVYGVHLKPHCHWKECAWVRLAHDSEQVGLIATSFKYLPYALWVTPLNVAQYVDEIWDEVISLFALHEDTHYLKKEIIKTEINDRIQFLSKYDKLNVTARLSAVSKSLWAKDAKEKVEAVFSELPNDTLAKAGVAILRSELGYGDAVNPALDVLRSEVPHGYYTLRWARNADSGPGLLELIRPIALRGLELDSPLILLKDSPYTKPATAYVLRDIAFKFREKGDEQQALNQLRNGAAVAGTFGRGLTKQWCLDLAEQADRVEKGCLAAALAYHAADVIHLGP
ncbi:MAG: hypothetical protein DKINENOH_03306 [bacterium]|nr:hypothetical protein [bacterium]